MPALRRVQAGGDGGLLAINLEVNIDTLGQYAEVALKVSQRFAERG